LAEYPAIGVAVAIITAIATISAAILFVPIVRLRASMPCVPTSAVESLQVAFFVRASLDALALVAAR
jgi:hypothetical protein